MHFNFPLLAYTRGNTNDICDDNNSYYCYYHQSYSIITFIFSSWIGRDHKTHVQLVGTRVATRVVACAPTAPCPAFRLDVRQVILQPTR